MKSWILAGAILLVGLLLGWSIGRSGGPDDPGPGAEVNTPEVWTCSMHPQIQLPAAGDCPICGMDLIPLTGSGPDIGSNELVLTPAAMKRAAIQTVPVERRHGHVKVRMVGEVAVDETRLRTITSWVPGRLDRLFIDYTGVNIRRGDHMVQVYSPDLVIAQEELLAALAAKENADRLSSRSLPPVAQGTLTAAREKLGLLGLSSAQINRLEETRAVEHTVTINAPIDGVVLEKIATEGMYVATGSPIYRIADLSRVWALVEAYESDLQWIRYGQRLRFSAEAFPGRTFEGTVAFIDPVLDPRTRTARVRINVANDEALLKPGMFVRAVVDATVSAAGRVMDPELAGKWMCPMHPEEVAGGPARCSVCQMKLVPVEKLGFEPAAADGAPPLVVPLTAPLITGERAVVYVRVPGREEPTFEGREVVLGSRLENGYVVVSGLAEGEEVVVNGAFKIDSAMQILARPSMMSPSAGAPDHGSEAEAPVAGEGAASDAFQSQLRSSTTAYLDLQTALAADDLATARSSGGVLAASLSAIDPSLLDRAARPRWEELRAALDAAAAALSTADDLGAARTAFDAASTAMIAAVAEFGVGDVGPLFVLHCPMAFDNRGADWLQDHDTVDNPFYGAAMLRCGEVRQTLVEGP